MKVEEIVEQQIADENPSAYVKELTTDVLGFGGGALLTHLGLEYATANYIATVAAESQIQQDWILAGGKLLGGIVVFAATAKYVKEAGFMKKFLYGIGAGMFTSASSDIVAATM